MVSSGPTTCLHDLYDGTHLSRNRRHPTIEGETKWSRACDAIVSSISQSALSDKLKGTATIEIYYCCYSSYLPLGIRISWWIRIGSNVDRSGKLHSAPDGHRLLRLCIASEGPSAAWVWWFNVGHACAKTATCEAASLGVPGDHWRQRVSGKKQDHLWVPMIWGNHETIDR